ncbi:hypothetical protein CCACVL1_00272 [Corchorus capsularis]|uniref:Uncharacterized protein n=1 Tax=Corchorus capsularis TaxID=210143 RepID=A0A1R3KXF6_COCAP|nr:hypothetical protein CCACVL1_00272 [Corchorus capsularis]
MAMLMRDEMTHSNDNGGKIKKPRKN